jgi:hypothetical protein
VRATAAAPDPWPSVARARLLPALLLVAAGTATRADVQVPPLSPSAGSRWSAGLLFGGPLGASAKLYRGGKGALDLNLGLAYGPGARVWGDYLIPIAAAPVGPGETSAELQIYAGLGVLAGFTTRPCGVGWDFNTCQGDPYLGARGAIGSEAVFRKQRFVVGLELAPGLALAPGHGYGLLVDAFLSARLLL